LLDSYQSLYPDYKINWTNMVETMGRTSTPKERIENLIHVNQIHFPEQPIDWEYLLDEFVKPCQFHQNATLFQEKIHFLFMCGMSARVEALAFKVWRDHITNMIETSNFKWDFHPKTSGDNSDILHRIREKLDQFEDKLLKLKEVTSILEIVLWTMRLNEKGGQDMATQSQKKIKTEGISIRQQCRVTCGADIVIRHVMPYLISV
jgi:predicted house-cleaning noncanonical NTP pyrophosphatase (MazG superfamily)